MHATEPSEITEFVIRIKTWPIGTRITRIHRILETLDVSAIKAQSRSDSDPRPTRGAPAEEALGLLRTDREPPDDNLQVACAIEAQLDAIVSRDPRGFALSPVAVLIPAEPLARIANFEKT